MVRKLLGYLRPELQVLRMKRRLQLDMRRELGHDKGEKIVTPQGLSPRDWKKHLCILCCI